MVISRRSFCRAAALAPLGLRQAHPQSRFGTAGCASEWSFHSGKAYRDPFNEVDLDVVFVGPGASERRVPAFWSGGSAWRVRYAAPAEGRYTWRTICSDPSNPDGLAAIGYSQTPVDALPVVAPRAGPENLEPDWNKENYLQPYAA